MNFFKNLLDQIPDLLNIAEYFLKEKNISF